MDEYDVKEIAKALNKIASCLGWIALWAFLMMYGVCTIANHVDKAF